MILGHGDIALVLPDRKDLLFFASGVSNSKETDKDEFKREKRLLLQQDDHKHLVYFSSLAVFYSNTPYADHKREMEALVKAVFPRYTIIRIGNILWEGKNKNTFINAYRDKPYTIKDEYRYVVDKEEFLHWIELIPTQWSCEMNIPGRKILVKDILKEVGLI